MFPIETRTYLNYIDGQFSASSTGKTLEIFCPGDGQRVSIVPASAAEDIDRGVEAARRAFFEEDWAFNPRLRSQAMFAWAAQIREHLEEVAYVLSAETGKPLGEARFEVNGSLGYLEYYASAVRTLYGGSTAVNGESLSITAREPVGVVGGIVPWNYPITLFMRDMAPALATGNTIVVKPAGTTAGSNLILMELLDQCGLFPRGVVNCVSGQGSVIGDCLLHHPDVDMISFTGSLAVGKHIMRECAETMKKVSLELGGKSANIIFEDADLSKALPYAMKAMFTHAGQICFAGTRVVVQRSIAADFVKQLKQAAEALVVGHGFDSRTTMGPVNSEKQLQSVLDYIEVGKQWSKLVTGGYRLTDGELSKGYFIAPTIFLDPPVDCPIVQEEIFGPVMVVQTFDTEEEAIALANGTPYGLASAVWTKDVDRGMRVARRMRAGSAWINCYNRLFPECETGGYKMSGFDRAGGVEGMMKYTEVKHICVDWGK